MMSVLRAVGPHTRLRVWAMMVCVTVGSALLAGCGNGNGNNGGGSGGGTTLLQGNAGFRAATVASYKSLGAGVAYPFTALKIASPAGSALRNQALSRQAVALVRAATTRAASLTFVPALNLYSDGGAINGTTAAVNFFVDAAGTQPAGSITITLPPGITASSNGINFASYPATVPISVTVTAGNIPCSGNFTLTFTGKSGANSLTGLMMLTRDNVTFNVDLGLDDQFNVSGAITVKESGATIQATNVRGNLGGTLSCDVRVLPYNWTGAGTLSLLNGSMSLNLNTGTGVSSATADSAGNVTITYADGTKDTIHDAFLAGLIAGSNDSNPGSSGSGSSSGTGSGGTGSGGTGSGGTGSGGTGSGGTGGTGGGTTTPTYNAPVNLGSFTPAQVNNNGQILGISTDTSQVPVFMQSSTAAIQKLPGATGPFQSGFSGVAMNNHGQIVGFSGSFPGVLWQSATSQPQMLAGNGSSPAPAAIGDNGLIVGQTFNSFSPVTTAWTDPKTAFTMQSLGIYDMPLAISSDGQIVGWTYHSDAITVSYWKNYQAAPTALETGGNNRGVASMSINAHGQICGTLNNGGGPAYWPSPTSPVQLLPNLFPSSFSEDSALSINASGIIVGSAFVAGAYPQNYHAVVWKNLQVQDLNSLIPAGTGWVLRSANSINDQGVIVGTGVITVNGKQQIEAFLLTPK